MTKIKVAEFGSYFRNVDRFRYTSSRTLLEFDMLFLDFPFMLDDSYTNRIGDYERRKKELEEFIHYKNIPIIYFTPEQSLFNVYINNVGRSKSLDFFVPIPKTETDKQSGTTIEIESKGLFTDFLTKYQNHFYYSAYLSTFSGSKIASTPVNKKPLGFWAQECVFLPPVKESVQSVQEDFFNDLYSVIKKIRVSRERIELPEWTKDYLLPTESELVNDIALISDNIEALNNELQIKREQYDSVAKKKIFFVATGSELEEEIEKLLLELGFIILETGNNREDLVVQYKDKIAVVEVKGVKGSSAEKHSAQLEKWSAEYFARTGTKPKPILIVNAYKDNPLIERNEPVFPDQMLRYSTLRDHCLISTLQLLGLYYHIQNDPIEADSQIENLFSTVGTYKEFNDWDKFISLRS
ncbi:hypothetical protein [Spirosoma lituiforme]